MSDASSRRIAGKKAIVTGAANGLGRAIAQRLAAEGAAVACVDIDGAGAETVAAAICSDGGHALPVVCDVTEEAPVRRMVDEALGFLGHIDILVNNAGGGTTGHIWEATAEAWDHVIRLNLRSAFLCTRHVVPHMMHRKSGRIIGLSSGAREGTPWTAYYTGNSAYAAAKAGIHGFSRNAALELAAYNITVNTVAPGPIETDRTIEGFRKLADAHYGPTQMTPLRRLGHPEEVAAAVLYLASDEAAYVTGVTLPVAGGR